jgi:hypothetical protein
MTRYLLTLLALVLMAAIGAFFAYVALMPTVIAALIVLGLALMFGLGVYVGIGPRPASQRHSANLSARSSATL